MKQLSDKLASVEANAEKANAESAEKVSADDAQKDEEAEVVQEAVAASPKHKEEDNESKAEEVDFFNFLGAVASAFFSIWICYNLNLY